MGRASELDHAWAAGIIDGEGCITIKIQQRKYYHLQVIVGQSGETLPLMLKKLQRLYGGNIGNPYTEARGARLPKWYWQAVCGVAEEVLKKIMPYLVQKKDQAKVALRYRRGVGNPGGRITARQREISENCYQQLRSMKRYRKTHSKWRIKDA